MTRPIVPPPPKAKFHKKRLGFLLILHLVLAFMMLFYDWYDGFTELINALILACSFMQMHFCYLLFYMIVCINSFATYLSYLGLAIQDKKFTEFYHETPL